MTIEQRLEELAKGYAALQHEWAELRRECARQVARIDWLLSLPAIILLVGCGTPSTRVISATATSIGVEISQNPATQLYQAKLGYQRGEVALVPTDKVEGTNGRPGAASTANVIMELRYQSIFSFSDAGIYQRLAVGSDAVKQPGAALMFARGKGEISPEVAKAVMGGVAEVPTTNPKATATKLILSRSYTAYPTEQKTAFDAIAVAYGYRNFSEFLVDPNTTPETAEKILAAVAAANLLH